MAKTDVTEKLEHDISVATKKIGVFGCFEVTIGLGGNERVDYMTLDSKGTWRCYEIKCSLSDFRSKAAKSFYGHYNYYVFTSELYEKVKDEIPTHIGIYVGKRLMKKPKRVELSVSDDVLKMSFIRSLSREAGKYHKSQNPKAIESYNRKISQLESENDRLRREQTDLRNKLFRKYGRNWQEIIELEGSK